MSRVLCGKRVSLLFRRCRSQPRWLPRLKFQLRLVSNSYPAFGGCCTGKPLREESWRPEFPLSISCTHKVLDTIDLVLPTGRFSGRFLFFKPASLPDTLESVLDSNQNSLIDTSASWFFLLLTADVLPLFIRRQLRRRSRR